jgi:hypothetical protein
MPWLSRRDFDKLLRKANERMMGRGKSERTFGLNELGYLLWRLDPTKQSQKPGEIWNNPFEYIDVYECGEKVFIFLVHNEQALTFEDTLSLYPSDELVAKLRLLLQ